MNVKQIMTGGVEMIDANATMADAAKKMRELDVGFIPVTSDGNIAGVLTDRDIVVRGVAEGMEPSSAKVSDIISSEVIMAYDDESVEDVEKRMADNKIRRIVVISRDDEPVGVISLGDLAVQYDEKKAGHTLEEVSTPVGPER